MKIDFYLYLYIYLLIYLFIYYLFIYLFFHLFIYIYQFYFNYKEKGNNYIKIIMETYLLYNKIFLYN